MCISSKTLGLTQNLDYQGLPWEYSFNAHHDLETLIQRVGGAEKFTDRLELTFRPGMVNNNFDYDRTIFNPANEPSFGTPYLYNFVGRQDLSVLRSRFVAKTYYHPTPDGLPGNSDAGAMESWLLWNMIGMYPLTGQTTFLIGSPWFEELTIDLENGKKLEVTSTGGSDTSFYVQSLKVNGQKWNKSWVTWDDIFAQGGTLAFELGPEPKDWATGPPPPSPASEKISKIPTHWRWFASDTMVGVLIAVSVLATGSVIVFMLRMRSREPPTVSPEEVASSTHRRHTSRELEVRYTSMGVGYVDSPSSVDLESMDGKGTDSIYLAKLD